MRLESVTPCRLPAGGFEAKENTAPALRDLFLTLRVAGGCFVGVFAGVLGGSRGCFG